MNVPVTACWAPTTSLLRRDISSPVRVAVKNPSDIPSTCSYSWLRRSKMIPSPTAEEAHRCSTPNSPLTNGTATMITPNRVTRPRSSSGMAWSIRVRMMSGGASASTEMTRIVARTIAILRLYGVP